MLRLTEDQKREKLQLAAQKWNADLSTIQGKAEASVDEYAVFKWSELVWQEIQMYVFIGEQVTPDEFDWLVKRRGFDTLMIDYLKEMLGYLGIGAALINAKVN